MFIAITVAVLAIIFLAAVGAALTANREKKMYVGREALSREPERFTSDHYSKGPVQNTTVVEEPPVPMVPVDEVRPEGAEKTATPPSTGLKPEEKKKSA